MALDGNRTCEFGVTDADECRMMRERSVAGFSDDTPACPVHGDQPEPCRYCECGHAAHAHPYQSGPGMSWWDGRLAVGCECGTYREVRS